MVESENQDGMGRKPGGISLRERAAVGVIVLIVLAISVPNFLPDRRREKSKSLGTGMRALATAIEAYFVDHGAYPPMCPLRAFVLSDEKLKKAGGWRLMSVEPGGALSAGLTTPNAYIAELPADPFSPGASLPYAYWGDCAGWILFSPGPDGLYELDPPRDYDTSVPQPSARLLAKAYDPSNGTNSAGDVWRVRQ